MNIKIEDVLEIAIKEVKNNWGKILVNSIIIFLVLVVAVVGMIIAAIILAGIAIGIGQVAGSIIGFVAMLAAIGGIIAICLPLLFSSTIAHYINAKAVLEDRKLISVYKEIFTKNNVLFFTTSVLLRYLLVYVIFIVVILIGFAINIGIGIIVALLGLVALIVALTYITGEFNISLYKGVEIKENCKNLRQTYTSKEIFFVVLIPFVLGMILSVVGMIVAIVPVIGFFAQLFISMVGGTAITMAMITKINEEQEKSEQANTSFNENIKVSLESDTTKVEIDTYGAQITSVINGGIEYMWQAESDYWGRTAPVLFPFVGKLKDDRYEAGDSMISMNQHGFLRDRNFTLINQTKNSATFEYTSTLTDFDLYPCDFTVQITYQVIANKVTTTYNIINNSGYEMPYQIGAHPAFNVESVDDLTAIFPTQTVTQHYFRDGLQAYTETTEISDVKLSYDAIDKNIPCYSDLIDHKLTLQNKGQDFIKFEFDTMNYLAIWSPEYKKAKFVCIEPWNGICSRADQQGYLLENKDGMNFLAANSSSSCSYSFEIC